jgi:undecaprenyl-diphosphatase
MIEQVDRDIFFIINGAHHPVLDVFMLLFSNKFAWFWFYMLILGMGFRKLGLKVFVFSLFAISTVFLTDFISVHGFKEVFQRFRPCHNVDFGHLVRVINGCGGKFGFVSSHAANSAGLASLVAMSGVLVYEMPIQRKFLFQALLFSYPVLNGYSRIYLGVHYPYDVAAGFALGSSIGLLIGMAWNYWYLRHGYPTIKSPKQTRT